MSTYFDSRDPACKSPFGAVPCGTEVSFAVFCTDEENIAGGALHVTEEFAGRIAHTIKRYPYIAAVKNDRIIGYRYNRHRGSGCGLREGKGFRHK